MTARRKSSDEGLTVRPKPAPLSATSPKAAGCTRWEPPAMTTSQLAMASGSAMLSVLLSISDHSQASPPVHTLYATATLVTPRDRLARSWEPVVRPELRLYSQAMIANNHSGNARAVAKRPRAMRSSSSMPSTFRR